MPDYPGLGLPLRYDRQKLSNQSSHYPIAAHDGCWGAISKLIYVRELAMMSIMDGLTDKEDWHTKVFNEEIVSKWRAEALAIPDEQFWMIAIRDKQQTRNNHGKISTNHDNVDRRLEGIMNASTFDCCIEELRSKAKYYERTGVIPTLDACASVAKSDHLVSADLHNSLCEAFDTLKSDQSSSLDWHPNSDDMVQDLVHPSMYPLVHGRSRIMKDEAVGVNDAIEKWAGKGEIIPLGAEIHRGTRNTTWGTKDRIQDVIIIGQTSINGCLQTWLSKKTEQSNLPATLTTFIQPDTPRFIAQLKSWSRPLSLYGINVLLLISTTIQKHGAGRLHPRFPYPEDPDDENTEHWNPSGPEPVFGQKKSSLETGDKDEIDIEGTDNEMEEEEEEEDAEEEWKEIRKPVIPEPFFQDIDYSIKLRLAHQFHESGLQIIIKMASIELTPEKPEFPAGSWHIEGQMNEHIAGTALYYLDSENITSSDLSFRMQTREDINNDLETGQDSYSWLEQGRLLAFPNVFQHKVSSFRLEDPTKPGHRRFIALWLVDPTLRVISTANVPPQQLDWWADSVFGNTPEARRAAMSKLPAELVMLLKESGLNTDTSTKDMKFSPELMEMVREYFNDNDNPLLMGIEEAKEHKLKLMEERGAFVTTTGEAWHNTGYNFCEH
ncbi:hypothetical protein H4I96_03661 [Botrytis cinerea]